MLCLRNLLLYQSHEHILLSSFRTFVLQFTFDSVIYTIYIFMLFLLMHSLKCTNIKHPAWWIFIYMCVWRMYMYHVTTTQIKTLNIPHMLEESLIPPLVNNPQNNDTLTLSPPIIFLKLFSNKSVFKIYIHEIIHFILFCVWVYFAQHCICEIHPVLHVAVRSSFSSLYSIPAYEFITIYSYTFPLIDTWVLSYFRVL